LGAIIGIRQEDKNQWERRVPLTPDEVARLVSEHGLSVLIQPSVIRCYRDDEYRAAGAKVQEDLGPASLVLAVKEIPTTLLRPGKTYLYFAHVVKAQRHNMPMLKRLLDLGCNLVDYERITDEKNRRLVFFGRYAGCAGMIDTLWTLGQRLAVLGIVSPLVEIQTAHAYADLAAAKADIKQVGERIAREGLPDAIHPIAIGITGYGNVSQGAQEVLDCLPVRWVSASDLPEAANNRGQGDPVFVAAVFKEADMVRPADPAGRFDLDEYYNHPERYAPCVEESLPHLDVLINAIYWTPRYPRFVTREWTQVAWAGGTQPRLKVIGDISCDITGGIEITVKTTTPDAPVFIYDPVDGSAHDGFVGHGPVIMSIDNLPCELPRESSQYFSSVLGAMVVDLARADWQTDYEKVELPGHLKRAVIVHHGRLTPSYQYLQESIPD
jgi:alpha-aminoadipic semialdehyde synthase